MPILNDWKHPEPICSTIKFPLNIIHDSSMSNTTIGGIIENTLNTFSKAALKYGFIWIDAKKYCGIEYALYNELMNHKCSTGFLLNKAQIYYFELNKTNSNDVISTMVSTKDADNQFIFENSEPKIFIIDHIENVADPQWMINISNTLQTYKETVKNLVVIFINKCSLFNDSLWKKVKEINSDLAIQRGVYIQVAQLSNEQIAEIIEKSGLDCNKKELLIAKVEQFDEHFKCAYFLDRLLSYIFDATHSVPEDFKSFNLLFAIYSNKLAEVFNETTSFDEYILSCQYALNKSMEDMPIKQFVFAYGIAKEINLNIKEVKSYLNRIFIEFKSKDEQMSVCEEIFELLEENQYYNFLLSLVNQSIWAAGFAINILVDKLDKTNLEYDKLVKPIFIAACNVYNTATAICDKYNNCERGEDKDNCIGNIKSKLYLGYALGNILKSIKVDDIEDGFNHIFQKVANDYVLPQFDERSGVSVCPITNFEFKKFVEDNGYSTLVMPNTVEARTQYYRLYKDLISKIEEASSTDNQRIRRRVARALKGADWMHYKRLSNILREMREKNENGEIIVLKKVLNEFYKDKITAPVKWKEPYNERDEFCNLLQPVVGISLFEAQAYVEWLSQKSGKNIRLVKFNPDYLTIVGAKSSDIFLNARFEEFSNKKSEDILKLINTRENRKCYYGPNNSGDQGPAPVGMVPQYKCCDSILDFLGNIYEMQTTEYSYNGENFFVNNMSEVWQRLHNCSGGGWQHTRANLPPEYMGQFTALTRNPDIGFRVVLETGQKDIIYNESIVDNDKTSDSEENFVRTYNDSMLTKYYENVSESSIIDLDKIDLKLYNEIDNKLTKSSLFKINGGQKSVIFFSKEDFKKHPKNMIMLLSKGYEIFAYYLQNIVSVTTNSEIEGSFVQIIDQEPVLPENSNIRKNWSNRECADIIKLIQINDGNSVSFYSAIALDIACGRLKIDNIKKVNAEKSDLFGLWEIEYLVGKEDLLENIKWKLSAEFFLPDWIDLFKFIELSSESSNDLDSEIDTNTVMAVLSTIDTADLHKLIDF